MGNVIGMSRLVIIYCCLLLSACGDDCQNQIISESASPDGQNSAILFQRDCGATTGFTTQISILPQGERPERSGNVFVADDNNGAAQAGNWGGPWASMKWLDSSHLQVTYAKESRVFDETEHVRGVTVSYDAKPSR
jgi:hypothetical protein